MDTTLADLRSPGERDTRALVGVHRTLMNLANGTTVAEDGSPFWPRIVA